MLTYKSKLKIYARQLRNNQTRAEQLLWLRVRRKQIANIQFYPQKPINNYIVDFYAPSIKLIIEVDGGSHFEERGLKKDKNRDADLRKLGLTILHFDNLQVLRSIEDVVEMIYIETRKRE